MPALLQVLARRLLGLLATLFVASFVVYGSVYVSPGSPESVLFGGRQPSPEVLAAARAHLGLDEPFLVRYFHWLREVLGGDLGTSLISQQPVTAKLGHPLEITLLLVLYAAVIIVVAGLGLGLLSALNPGPVDAAITGVVSVATAVPAFVASSVLIDVFAVRLGWFPPFGLGHGVGGYARGLTLPALSLAIISSGLVARVTRAAALEQNASEHVRTAVSRGVSRRRIIRAHVLRNAAGPIATVTGLQVAGLFAAAVVVEQAFGLGGLGQVLISSVQQKDFPVVQAICLVLVMAFVVLNLAAELLGLLIDPRARKAGAA
jgi:peptide/nickel transport system permease protein